MMDSDVSIIFDWHKELSVASRRNKKELVGSRGRLLLRNIGKC